MLVLVTRNPSLKKLAYSENLPRYGSTGSTTSPKYYAVAPAATHIS